MFLCRSDCDWCCCCPLAWSPPPHSHPAHRTLTLPTLVLDPPREAVATMATWQQVGTHWDTATRAQWDGLGESDRIGSVALHHVDSSASDRMRCTPRQMEGRAGRLQCSTTVKGRRLEQWLAVQWPPHPPMHACATADPSCRRRAACTQQAHVHVCVRMTADTVWTDRCAPAAALARPGPSLLCSALLCLRVAVPVVPIPSADGLHASRTHGTG